MSNSILCPLDFLSFALMSQFGGFEGYLTLLLTTCYPAGLGNEPGGSLDRKLPVLSKECVPRPNNSSFPPVKALQLQRLFLFTNAVLELRHGDSENILDDGHGGFCMWDFAGEKILETPGPKLIGIGIHN